jgi:predicted nucleotide-binding protein
MPTKRELLLSLRKGFEKLETFDRARLNGLKDRGNMIIRRVFGEDSPYEKRLSGISFRGAGVAIVSSSGGSVTPAERQRRERNWRSGQTESLALIDTMLEDLELSEFELPEPEWVETGEEPTGPKSDRVFVVHGHDEGMRESVARVLATLGLKPMILHEQPDRGRTIIEKFYDYSEVEFAVVLLSPDDMGYVREADPDTAQPRARQNVIMELGFFLGKLGRENVVALHKGNVEIPSDFSGVLFTPYVAGGDWPYKLTRELRASGYKVSADDL